MRPTPEATPAPAGVLLGPGPGDRPGDRHQELFELAQLAMQGIHLGRATEALQIANQVIEDEAPSPRVSAVFHLRRARALALMGDRTRALDEHDLAASVLLGGTSSRNDPAWTWWVDASELAWHRAMSLTALGDRHAAVDLFRLAYETRPVSARRARYNDLGHLVEAEVGVRAWRTQNQTLSMPRPTLPPFDPPGQQPSCAEQAWPLVGQSQRHPQPRQTSADCSWPRLKGRAKTHDWPSFLRSATLAIIATALD